MRAFLRKGAKIEVFSEGDWWLAHVVAINKNFVRVHYEGGEDDEDEWLEQNTDRIKESKGMGEPGNVPAAWADDEPDGNRAGAAGAKTPSAHAAKGKGGGSSKKAKSTEKPAQKPAEKSEKSASAAKGAKAGDSGAAKRK